MQIAGRIPIIEGGKVVGTNPGFRTIYGERLLDRMRDDGMCWVEIAGESARMGEPWNPSGPTA
jgi:hypothetical protein